MSETTSVSVGIVGFVDGLSAYERFWRLQTLRRRYLEADGDPAVAAEFAGRASVLMGPAAAFLSDLRALLDVVTSDALLQAHRDLLASDRLSPAVRGYLSKQADGSGDYLKTSGDWIDHARIDLLYADAPGGSAQFRVSDDALLVGGATLVGGGLVAAAAALSAPVTVPIAVGVGLASAAGFAIGYGAAMIQDALN